MTLHGLLEHLDQDSLELRLSPAATAAPRGSVLLAHGLGGHRGRNYRVASALNNSGFDVWSFDFLGHGQDPGRRAHAEVSVLIGQHLRMRQELKTRARHPQILLFGHSLGGLITLASALISSEGLSAVAVSAPALAVGPRISPWMARGAERLGRLAHFLSTPPLPAERLSDDPLVVARRQEDPLVHQGRIPLLTAAGIMVQAEEVLERVQELDVPTLIVHGVEDKIVNIRGSVEFVERALSPVELWSVPDGSHELLNEEANGHVLADLVRWLESQGSPAFLGSGQPDEPKVANKPIERNETCKQQLF